MADRITVDRKSTLDAPVQRDGGDYTVSRRTLARVHFSDEGIMRYFQEAGKEVGEFMEWTEDTKAAFLVFLSAEEVSNQEINPRV
jgi:hypothetical protein